MSSIDPYKILGVSKDATIEEIKKAYRSKAAKYHPDAGGDAWTNEIGGLSKTKRIGNLVD